MDGRDVVDEVREATGTELDRLGSEKALIAETDADLEPAAVLRAAALAEARARHTFEAWAGDEDHGGAAAAFRDLAEREAEHYDRIAGALDEPDDLGGDPEPDSLHDYLRGLDVTVERVGAGLVGRPLASARTLLQVVNFFVNEADATNADRFREIRAETEALVDDGADLLDEVCETEADYRRAEAAAVEAVEAVYREYAATLEAMGLDPKPVC